MSYHYEIEHLILCNKPQASSDANTIIDHISAFEDYSQHNISLLSNIGSLPSHLNLNDYHVVIIHYSLSLVNDYFISPATRKQLRDYQGLKIFFIQDEYRVINKVVSELAYIRADVLFTCFPEGEMHRIYNKDELPTLSKYTNLTGYIPERLFTSSVVTKTSERPIDVGYRSRKVPFYLGQLGYEKWNIVEQWKRHVGPKETLSVDISYDEQDRIYGDKWTEFLASCKTVLGVESGASVMDFTGQLQTLIDFHQMTYPEDSFDKIQNIYLKDYEGKYYLNQISPRCFEAIVLRTVLVLFEGEYSGILIPGRHYIMLKKDFSNISDVLLKIRDNDFLQNMADVTYNEIALNSAYSYQTFISKVDTIIETEFELRNKKEIECLFIQKDSFIETEFELCNKREIDCVFIQNDSLNGDHSSMDSRKIKKIRLIYSKIIFPILVNIHKHDVIKKIKHFMTHEIQIFNPILRKIKNIILRLA